MQRILTAPRSGLWVLLVLVLIVGFFPGLVVQGLTAVELEDDFLVATRELERQCVHRCPDQVSYNACTR